MLLSKLVNVLDMDNIEYKLVNEKEFDVFARITTDVCGKKCVFLNDEKYIKKIDDSITMVITTSDIATKLTNFKTLGVLYTENPRDVYFKLMITYEERIGCEYTDTVIGENCKISSNSYISPQNVIIGNNVEIGDFVWIGPNVEIKDNTIIQSGCKIGVESLNTYHYKGRHIQISPNGKTIIGENVLIGANSVVAQALYNYGITSIEEDTKIDACVSISHNNEIGKNVKICAGVILGGYVTIGDNSVIGLGATIKNAVKIGNNASVGMGSTVLMDVKPNVNVFGNPARRI